MKRLSPGVQCFFFPGVIIYLKNTGYAKQLVWMADGLTEVRDEVIIVCFELVQSNQALAI